jgi:hypothetical protein
VVDDAYCCFGVDESASRQHALGRLDPNHSLDATEQAPS